MTMYSARIMARLYSTAKVARKQLKQTEPIQDQLIHYVMKDGKKPLAKRIVTECLDYIQLQKQQQPLLLLQEAVDKVSPLVGVKGEKRGMKLVQTPIPLTIRQRQRVGIEWIVNEAKKQKKHPFGVRIGIELISILNDTSTLIQKKIQVHKHALSNRSNLILTDRKM
jgi:small subunit ribosomal protein S7